MASTVLLLLAWAVGSWVAGAYFNAAMLAIAPAATAATPYGREP